MAIITTIGAINSTIKGVKSVYKAPEELESLQNDLSDAELMIRDIKSYTEAEDQDQRTTGSQGTALQERLTDAEGIVVELQALVLKVLKDPNDPTSIRQIAWLKTKRRTQKLRKKLARIHEELPRHHNQAEGARIILGLKSISSAQLEISTGLSKLESHIDTTSHNVSQLKETSVSTQNLQNQFISSVAELRQDTSRRFESLESAISTNNNLHQDTTQRLENLESAILANNDLLQRLPAIFGLQAETIQQTSLTNSIQSTIEDSGNRTSGANANTITSIIHSSYQSIKFQTQYQDPNSCEVSCHCRCHSTQILNSPSFLKDILGRIFIGYKGIPFAKKCTNQKCKRYSTPKVYLSYYFPRWWVIKRMMVLLAQWRTAFSGPELLLRFPRCVGENSAVFTFAHYGNIEGLKLLFNNGNASPNDIDTRNQDVLTHAFFYRSDNLDTIKFLIQAGASTQVENRFGNTFEDRLCMAVLGGARSFDYSQWVTENFMSRRRQHFAFSNIHEIILKLRYTPLEEEISRCTSGDIDAQDVWGRTPLHWASFRGDLDAVSQLLRSGADPNKFDNEDLTPLLLSIRSRKINCVMYLLHHGANLQVCASTGWTALHYACAYSNKQLPESRVIEFLDTLLYMGIDINAQMAHAYSSLHLSLQDPENGSNILLKWLVDHGADHRLKTLSGRTILHQAAEFGNLESIQILRDAHLSDIDVNARLYDTGTTAMDELLSPHRLPAPSEELIASFKLLLAEIEARINGEPLPTYGIHAGEDDTSLSGNIPSVPGEFPILPENSEKEEVLPSDSPPMSKAPSAGTRPARDFEEESDSEDDLIFQDSIEHQVVGIAI